jgi:hypothetical protein
MEEKMELNKSFSKVLIISLFLLISFGLLVFLEKKQPNNESISPDKVKYDNPSLFKKDNTNNVLLSDFSKIDDKDRKLWEKTISLYLKDNLWEERDAYDAGHYLMVPLYAAFLMEEEGWQNEFVEHFNRFANNGLEKLSSLNRLNQLQYLYLVSQFSLLATESGNNSYNPEGLIDFLFEKVEKIWFHEPAWQWGRKPFEHGMKERFLWKLEQKDKLTAKNYYKAIIDEELFIFAIAADLRNYEKNNKPKEVWSNTITDILNLAYEVFKQNSVFKEGGSWLFQPGIWWDHPDYAFVGHKEKIPGMKPSPINDIAMDTSHSHRFPLWLTSLSRAYGEGEEQKNFYEKLKMGLEEQFYKYVLVHPTTNFLSYRTTNFMDGRNGVYRWNYKTQGVNNGYGPYELSGTLTLGWWTFLESERIKLMYREISELFPLPENIINLYVGPGTTRERHPLILSPGRYQNGMIEIITRLAGKVNISSL